MSDPPPDPTQDRSTAEEVDAWIRPESIDIGDLLDRVGNRSPLPSQMDLPHTDQVRTTFQDLLDLVEEDDSLSDAGSGRKERTRRSDRGPGADTRRGASPPIATESVAPADRTGCPRLVNAGSSGGF